MLEIRLLGEPEFWLGTERLRPQLRPRCLSLLGYLIWNRDRAYSRASVAALLWPDELEEDARSNLRRHLHLLSTTLPKLEAPLLLDGSRMLQWNPDAGARVDLLEFDVNAGSPETYDAAIALHRGEFLAGHDDEWAFEARESVRTRVIDMLLVLATASMRHGHFDRAIAYADKLLEQDEWREDAIRLRMQAQHRLGDRVGALTTFDRFAAALQREMKVQPTLDTVALHTSILANVPLGALDPDVDAASPLATVSTVALPFVGREPELSRLRSAWSRAARGHGSTVIVQGEAGIGKSRLTRQIALLAEQQGGCVLIGSTSNPQAEPHQPLVNALRRGLPYLAHAAIDDIWLATLGSLLPEVYSLRPHLAAPEPLDPRFAEPRLIEAFARALGAIARIKPLVLVLEDLQWTGDATVSMIGAIARRCASLPMLMIVTFRTADVDLGHFARARQALIQEHRAALIALGAMAGEEFRAINAPGSTFEDISDEIVARAAATSAGNPLFVTLLLQAYRESGALPEDPHAVRTVADAIALRLASLDQSARTIAQAGAVIGPAFDAVLLGRIVGWSDAEVYAALDALLDAGIVRETNASFEYTFTHALIERALYDALDAPTRALRHRRVAAILDRGDDPRSAAAVARHWLLAGRRGEARVAYERALEHALSVYAWSEAAAHAEAALKLCERDEDRLRILIASGSTLRDADVATRSAHARELAAVAKRLGTPEARMDALLVRCDVVRHAAERDQQREAAEQLLALAEAAQSRKYVAQALIALGMYHMDVADIAQCEATLRKALALMQPGDVPLEREAAMRTQLGHALMRLGRRDEAEAIVEDGRLRYATHLAELRYIVQLDAALAMARNNLSDAREACREMLRIDIARGDISQESISHGYLASCSDAFPDDAREHFARAYEIASTLGRRISMVMPTLNRGTLEEQLGRYDLALQQARSAYALATECGEITVQAHALINESAALRETGQVDEAMLLARRAYELIRDREEPRVVAAALASMGKAERARGNPSRAVELLDEAVILRRRAHSQQTIVSDLVALAEALLQAERTPDALAAADEIAALAVADLEEQLRPTKLCWVLAEVYAANGDRQRHDEWRERGKAVIATMLGRISDQETRDAFRALSYNRALFNESSR